jgi:hypothetical protein
LHFLALGADSQVRTLANSNLELFAHVVAQNAVVIYEPGTKRRHLIGDKAPADLIKALKEQRWNRSRSLRATSW